MPTDGIATTASIPSPALRLQPALGVAACDSALLFVILCPVGPYFDVTGPGIALFADPQYTRACPGGVGDKKMGSNYGPTLFIHQEALSRGLQQVLWLYGDDELVTEVGTMNIMMFLTNEDGGGCFGSFWFLRKIICFLIQDLMT